MEVDDADGASATLRYRHAPDAWPWAYQAVQRFEVSPDGHRHELTVRNFADDATPVGLGLHPYFSRAPDTRLIAHHRGEWRTASDGLPLSLDERADAVDWWEGAPVGARAVDTVYTGRAGPIRIEWPARALALDIEPSDALDHSVTFTPAGADFFCIEPVTHATDALNRGGPIHRLAPREALTVSVRFRVSRLR